MPSPDIKWDKIHFINLFAGRPCNNEYILRIINDNIIDPKMTRRDPSNDESPRSRKLFTIIRRKSEKNIFGFLIKL